jgi:PAS domain S-box-containing protein
MAPTAAHDAGQDGPVGRAPQTRPRIVPVIRPRALSDLGPVIELLREAHEHDGYPPFGWPEDPAAFLAPSAELHAWVAVHDTTILGHVALHAGGDDLAAQALAARSPALAASEVAVMARLVVARAARRTGLGQRLLERACDAARAAGFAPALDVAKHLPGAVGFYESLGWSRAGELAVDSPTGPVTAWVCTPPPSRLTRSAIVVAGPDGAIAVSSGGVTELFGYSPNELLGRKIDVLVPDRYRRRHNAGWRKAWAAGDMTGSPTSLIPVLCADGVVREFAGRLSPVTDPHGEVIAVAAIWSAPSGADCGLPSLT